MLHPAVEEHLIEIFKAVADAVDGGECDNQDVREAYLDALQNQHVADLYSELIDARFKEVYGETP